MRVRFNTERTVQRELQLAGIPEFLPLYKTESRWSDRTKTIERPLLPGYVFARVTARQLDSVIRVRGVVQILGVGSRPSAIPDQEIAALQQLVASPALEARPCEYTVGEKVIVESGPMAGSIGVVTRTKGALRLVVTIEILRRSVAVELDSATVTRVQETAKAQAA